MTGITIFYFTGLIAVDIENIDLGRLNLSYNIWNTGVQARIMVNKINLYQPPFLFG